MRRERVDVEVDLDQRIFNLLVNASRKTGRSPEQICAHLIAIGMAAEAVNLIGGELVGIFPDGREIVIYPFQDD